MGFLLGAKSLSAFGLAQGSQKNILEEVACGGGYIFYTYPSPPGEKLVL